MPHPAITQSALLNVQVRNGGAKENLSVEINVMAVIFDLGLG